MKRREFIITLAGGAAAAWPFTALAQQSERARRVGLLMNKAENDPESKVEILAFVRGLEERGWALGSNMQIEYRWGAGDANLYHKYAAELVALAPDILLAVGGTAVGALQQTTRTVPIVFVETSDPVNRGLIASLARPGGNTTGFTQFEFSMGGKWLALLKQIAPSVSRVAVVRDPVQFSGVGQLAAIQTAAPSFSVEVSPIDARDSKQIERAITAFERGSNGNGNAGLIVAASGSADANRKLIITLAARHRLPTIYPFRFFATEGGLISYGPDTTYPFRAATSYVDRILKGEKPADLPVQAPNKYELVINLKTAKALGLTIPPSVLAQADEVIE
jgi:putative tryptophan/tyrosine transport system substrate-binding protein